MALTHLSKGEQDVQKSLSVSVWKCGACRGCSFTTVPAIAGHYSVPASSTSLELGWDASALFYSPFGVRFGAQLSNVCLSRPHQAGDSNSANSAELGDGI